MGLKSVLRSVWKHTHVIRPLYWKLWKTKPAKMGRAYLAKKSRDRFLYNTLPDIYRAEASKPVDENKVIFVVYRGDEDQVNDSFELIERELRENYNFDIHYHYLHHSFVPEKEYRKLAGEMIKDMATAKYVFLDEANEATSCVPKRPETYITQLWHACGAFKKFGMSTADKIFGGNAESLRRHPNYRNLDLVTVSSEDIRWAYVEAMDLGEQPEIVKGIGISRTDRFYDEEYVNAAKERVYEKFPAARGKKVILYAPTFRGRVKAAKAPNKLNFLAFFEAFGDEYVIITKHHPFVQKLPQIPEDLEGTFVYEGTGNLDISDLLCVSDICISDYSSLVFEYSLFERPMLFFAYDREQYDDWRGFFYPYDEMTPGPICMNNREMIDYIKHVDQRFDLAELQEFRRKFMSACDGHATERIMKEVFGEDILEAHRIQQ